MPCERLLRSKQSRNRPGDAAHSGKKNNCQSNFKTYLYIYSHTPFKKEYHVPFVFSDLLNKHSVYWPESLIINMNLEAVCYK